MSRTEKAQRIDLHEREIAFARGALARAHNRPLGGVLEPKHASPELAAAFRNGWASEDAHQTQQQAA